MKKEKNCRLQQTNELNRTCTFECDLMQRTTNNTRVHSSILASFFEWGGVSDSSVLICGNLVGILFFSKNSASNDPTNSR